MSDKPVTTQSARAGMTLLALLGVRPLTTYRVRSIAAVTLGICPPIVFAWVGQTSGNWDLFERSGAITSAIGLLVASRRYVEHGLLELAMPPSNDKQPSHLAELLEDIFTAKIGLALAAFGTIVWGWGKYLGWWAFSLLLVWAFFAIRDIRWDLIRLRSSPPDGATDGIAPDHSST